MGEDQAFVYFRRFLMGVFSILGGPVLFQSVVLDVCLYLSPCHHTGSKLTLTLSVLLGFNSATLHPKCFPVPFRMWSPFSSSRAELSDPDSPGSCFP